MCRTVLLAFINCLVISTPQLKERNRLRNEFIGEFDPLRLLSFEYLWKGEWHLWKWNWKNFWFKMWDVHWKRNPSQLLNIFCGCTNTLRGASSLKRPSLLRVVGPALSQYVQNWGNLNNFAPSNGRGDLHLKDLQNSDEFALSCTERHRPGRQSIGQPVFWLQFAPNFQMFTMHWTSFEILCKCYRWFNSMQEVCNMPIMTSNDCKKSNDRCKGLFRGAPAVQRSI